MNRVLGATLLALLLLGQASPTATAQESGWQLVGFEGTPIHAMAASEDGQILYLSTDVGLHLSEDGGESWHYIGQSLDLAGAPPVVALEVHRAVPNVAYAGTAAGEGGGLYVTWDLGRHWQRIYSGDGADGVSAIALEGEDRHLIFLSVRPRTAGGDRLVMSWDGGVTWSTIFSDRGSHDYQVFEIKTSAWADLYVPDQQGILVSRNDGDDWRRPAQPRAPVFSLALHPHRPPDSAGPIYSASLSTLFESRDNGETWESIPGPPLDHCSMYDRGSLAIAPRDGAVLYVATRALCPDKAQAKVFARLTRRGLGRVWSNIGGGLPDTDTVRLATAGRQRQLLYALTDDGLWKLPLASQDDDPGDQAPTTSPVTQPPLAQAPPPGGLAPAVSPSPTAPARPASSRGDETDPALVLAGAVALVGTGAGITYMRLRRPKR